MTFKLTKRAIDRTGLKYGRLLVIEPVGRNNHSQILWKCLCDCGTEAVLPAPQLGHRANSCGCLKKDSPLLKHKKKNCESPFWKGTGEISGYKLNKIKSTASRRSIEYNVTDEYIWELFKKQKGLCALSGVVISFGAKGRELGTASLDRIDSNLGYIEGNVQWLHKDVNLMKMNLEEKVFLDFCEKIVDNKRNLNER